MIIYLLAKRKMNNRKEQFIIKLVKDMKVPAISEKLKTFLLSKEGCSLKHFLENYKRLKWEYRQIVEYIIEIQDYQLKEEFIEALATTLRNGVIQKEKLSIIYDLINNNNTKLIKKTILDLGTKFSRLSVSEISEKTNIKDEGLIVKLILQMIKNKELNAEYFSSTKNIVFNLQANREEIDKLLKMYQEWEEKGIGKKQQ